MAGLDALLQRIARSLEEASAQQPGDDLRARLGYGTGDDEEDEPTPDATWEEAREPRPARATARTPEASTEPETPWQPESIRKRTVPRSPAPPRTMPQAPETHRTPLSDSAFKSSLSSPTVPRDTPASPPSVLPERVRTRLGTANALREAFVVKEILDRPLSQRRR